MVITSKMYAQSIANEWQVDLLYDVGAEKEADDMYGLAERAKEQQNS